MSHYVHDSERKVHQHEPKVHNCKAHVAADPPSCDATDGNEQGNGKAQKSTMQ